MLSGSTVLSAWLFLVLMAAGCGKDATYAAIETDAHGYLCEKCGAKLYTDAKSYLASKCPKCGEYSLDDVVAYKCSADQHVTVKPRVSGPAGAAVCEQCGASLKNAMVAPREKDLKAWGATKTSA